MTDNLKAIFLAVLVKWIATAEMFASVQPMAEPISRIIISLILVERAITLFEMYNIPLPWFLRKKKTEEPKQTAKEGDKRYNPETGDLYIFDGECWRQW